jgi:cysteinylglycine-S-conjugate dipeptidase
MTPRMTPRMIWSRDRQWRALVTRWVAARPIAGNPDGLALVRDDCVELLRNAGFTVELLASDVADEQPIVLARRPGRVDRWLGISSHYDVEQAPGEWRSDPWTVCERERRLYGRGLADNLGPLAQRLLSFADLPATDAGVVWVIEGEEELGSTWAQRLFPRLELPPIAVWLEETGYFYKDGAQRVLTMGPKPTLAPIVAAITEVAAAHGRGVRVRERFLNKAFGQDRCPTLQHLVGAGAYLAIGPNDDQTRVHAPDESIDPALLALCHAQLERLLEVLG